MVKQLRSVVAAVLVGGALAACGAEAQQKVNADAQVLQDFKARIDAYMDLHNRLEKQSPPLKETNDPGKIQQSQDALAAKLREARKDAKAGDIFTPEIRELLRRLMYPETTGREGKETKEIMKEDAPPAGAVTMKVNAKYPEAAPLPTVPPKMLAALPELPEDLEYRMIGRNLILRDVHANLIVDFIPNAIR